MQLGQGFRPFLLNHLKQIVGMGATPQYKMEPLGFLNFLQSQTKPKILRLNTDGGHQESVQVKYKQRWTKDFVSPTIDCEVTNRNSYRETAVALSSTVAFGIHIEDETIAKYEDEASKTVMVGQPATPLMNEFLEEIYGAANALLMQVNEDLLTVLSSRIGVNRRTGNNNAATLNLNKQSTVNDLTTGLTLLLSDYQFNGMKSQPQVIGGGLFHNFMLQQPALSANQAGLDMAIQAAGLKFYYDLDVANAFGANEIIVAEPNAIQIVEYMRNVGFKAGPKPGSSTFGVIPLPMTIGNDVLPVEFDFQLRYNDCAKTFTEQYYGTTFNVEPGWNLILSKQCGLFTVPSDAYRAGDPLVGNRGTLRYDVTNTCQDCEA